MALNMPTFYKRAGSAIVFAAIMLTCLLWDNFWAFLALVCTINFLCLRDYFKLMRKIDKEASWPPWIPVVVQVLGFFLVLLFSRVANATDTFSAVLWTFFKVMPLLVPVLFIAATLFKKNALPALLMAAGGICYITLPMVFFSNLRAHDMVLPVAVVAMIWINDTMAYIVGSFIGKTPFSPISPKKTREGTGGGALLTILAAAVYGYSTHSFSTVHWVMIAVCATIAGTLGDLLESKLKRLADVKDSGNMMPGHGGALDRFDSLLLAIPVVFVYYSLFM